MRPSRPRVLSGEEGSAKWRAAAAAVAEVEDGMVLGLGSGSTAEMALRILAARVAGGLRVSGVPTSERTAELARRLGVPLTDFSAHAMLDLAIDGADEVEPASLALIKGRGGALLREKIVAGASRRVLIVVDETKLVERLGRGALPVEIAAFGWQTTLLRLDRIGAHPTLRRTPGGSPFMTDGGGHVADCRFAAIEDARDLDAQIRSLTGVAETGLFLDVASSVVVAGPDGVRVLGARLLRTA